MPTAQNSLVQGTFTVPSSLPGSVNLNLGFIPTRFQATNRSKLGNNGAAYIQNIYWDSNMTSSQQGYVEYITSAGTTLNIANVSSNGVVTYNGAQGPLLGSAITGTTITKANPAVCTAAAHGLQTGDVVQFTGNVVMKQLGGLSFTVTVTGANTFTIPLNTNTANFTAETGFTARKLLVPSFYYPGRHNIAAISAASPMVIDTLVAHGLTVGQQVRIRVPSQFGMTQANKLQGVITAVTSTTITLGGIDSSAFTAFAWPAATSVPFTPARIIPIGSGPSAVTLGAGTYFEDNLDDATWNQAYQGISIGTGILQATAAFVVAASDVFTYTAWRGDV